MTARDKIRWILTCNGTSFCLGEKNMSQFKVVASVLALEYIYPCVAFGDSHASKTSPATLEAWGDVSFYLRLETIFQLVYSAFFLSFWHQEKDRPVNVPVWVSVGAYAMLNEGKKNTFCLHCYLSIRFCFLSF